MEKAKRARKAETLKQPSLCLRLRAPYLYPDPSATPILGQPFIDCGSIDIQDTRNILRAFPLLNILHGALAHRFKCRVVQLPSIVLSHASQ
jgi:hypothetical protein